MKQQQQQKSQKNDGMCFLLQDPLFWWFLKSPGFQVAQGRSWSRDLASTFQAREETTDGESKG